MSLKIKIRLAAASIAMSIVLILSGGCRNNRDGEYIRIHGFALGTTYSFIINQSDSSRLQWQVDSLFAVVDNSMSVYNPRSLLSRLNRNETDSVDIHIRRCIETAAIVSRLSGGAYDITIKPVTEALGFNAEDAQEHPDIDSLLRFVGYRKIRIEQGRLIKENPGIQIDLNSVAKGYTVDLLAELVSGRGATDYMLEVGGEIVCRGRNPKGKAWRIGIDKPSEGNNVPGADIQLTIGMEDAALATSGNYRKYYTSADGHKIVHTIDALTGLSSQTNLLSATVVAPRCALADAYGTMLMIVGLDRAKQILENTEGISGCLIYSDHRGEYETYISEDIKPKIIK